MHHVFQSFSVGSDLSVGLAIGQSDFSLEQEAVTVDTGGANVLDARKQKLLFDPGNIELLIGLFSSFDGSSHDALTSFRSALIPRGGRSAIDVLVCTPGRLVEHLENTPGLTLQHLRFLVVDEADRLLDQTYHNWINRVVDSAISAPVAAWHELSRSSSSAGTNDTNRAPGLIETSNGCSFDIDMISWRRGGTVGEESLFSTIESGVVPTVCIPLQLRKMLFSATLTRDPQKLAALRLVNPKHYDARILRGKGQGHSSSGSDNHKYTMPNQLLEYIVECTAEQKPIVLLALLLDRRNIGDGDNNKVDDDGVAKGGGSIIAVFTSNLESTHRLTRLLQLLWKSAGYGTTNAIAEYSGSWNQKERSHIMSRCGDVCDNISVVVCSDGMSRGVDIDQVGMVINYDVPGLAKTYVHRCGRTARAGKEGRAISLLKGGQVDQFLRMRRLIEDPNRIKKMGFKKSLVIGVVGVYISCLKALADVVAAESRGDLKPTDPIPANYFI